jgi:SAM-dependent methyltransferase
MLELFAGAEGALDIASARAAIEEVASREEVAAAVATVTELVPDEDSWEADNRAAIAARYGVVRPFVRLLATVLPLQAAPAGRELLAEIHRLPELLSRRISQKPLGEADLNMNLVTGTWRRAVLANPALDGAADRDAYVMCLLTQLTAALRRRDIFAYPSLRWGDPRAQLLDGAEWSGVRDDVLAGLGLTGPVEEHLAEMVTALDGGWRQLAQRIEEAGPDASVRVVPGDGGRMRLSVSRLEKLGDPPSLVDLRKRVAAMLPLTDIPEVLMHVHSWTGMLDAYQHVGGLNTSMDDLPLTVAGLLVADACNVGLVPIINPAEPALTRDRLSYVDQNYIRPDTHATLRARDYRFPYPDGTFDIAVLASVFTHMLPEDMEHYVAEIARMLKKQGRCYASFSLINSGSRDPMETGRSSLRFKQYTGACWVVDAKVPELAVGYDETYVRGLYERQGFRSSDIHYGSWSGRFPAGQEPAFSQDIVVSTKQ